MSQSTNNWDLLRNKSLKQAKLLDRIKQREVSNKYQFKMVKGAIRDQQPHPYGQKIQIF